MKKKKLVFKGAQERDVQTFLRAVVKIMRVCNTMYVDANVSDFENATIEGRYDCMFSVIINPILPNKEISQTDIDIVIREITTSTGAVFLKSEDDK